MDTNNSNIKTWDMDSVFTAYTSYLASKTTDANNRTKELDAEIANLTALITELENTASERAANLKNYNDEISAKNEEIKKYPVLTEEKVNEHNALLNQYKDLQKSLQELQNTDTSTMTAEQKTEIDNQILDLNNKLVSITNNVLTAENELKVHTENGKKIEEINNDIKKLNSKIEEINKKDTELTNSKQSLQVKTEEKNNLPSTYADNSDNFAVFLASYKLSTVHAEEIYNKKVHSFTKDEVKLRKMHPVRDTFIKKILIPATLTGAGIGFGLSALATSGLTSGANFLGFIPVMSSAAVSQGFTIATGTAIGAAAAVGVITLSKAATIAYYNIKYKSGAKNLEDYAEKGISLENLQLTKLINKIAKTKEDILQAKGLKKHILNAMNRDRVHQLEKITKDLVEIYTYRKDANDKNNAEQLKPVYTLLEQIENFIIKDVEGSKSHALLTCTETKDHKHTSWFENIDIYANLKTYLSFVTTNRIDNKQEFVKQQKTAKSVINNLDVKLEKAMEIIEGKRLIPQMLDYEELTRPVVTNPVVTNPGSPVTSRNLNETDNTVTITTEDGNTYTYPISEVGINEIERINTTRTATTIYYTDGTSRTIKAKGVKNHSEIYIVASQVKKNLENAEFVKNLKNTYNIRSINNLKNALTTWLAENENEEVSKLLLKATTKKVYEECVAILKANERIKKDDATAGV